MSSSDIYEVKESPWAKKEKTPAAPRRRRRSHSTETFDEAISKDVTKTNRRRHGNRGFRRFRHLMKKPKFNKNFWLIILSSFTLILILLIVWDRFVRYPGPMDEVPQNQENPISVFK